MTNDFFTQLKKLYDKSNQGIDSNAIEQFKGKLSIIPIKSIVLNNSNPRIIEKNKDIDSLANNIKKNGLINPILVKEITNGTYELIAGERRLKAHELLSLNAILALVIPENTINEQESFLISVSENLNREDFHYLDESRAYKTLRDTYQKNQKEIAELFGRTESYISEHISFSEKVTNEEIKMIVDNGISKSVLREALKFEKNNPKRKLLLERPETVKYARKMTACKQSTEKLKPKSDIGVVYKLIWEKVEMNKVKFDVIFKFYAPSVTEEQLNFAKDNIFKLHFNKLSKN